MVSRAYVIAKVCQYFTSIRRFDSEFRGGGIDISTLYVLLTTGEKSIEKPEN